MADTPATLYHRRVASFAALRDATAQRWGQVANLRLGVAIGTLVAAGAGWWYGLPALQWLAALLAAAFLALVAFHNRLRAHRDRFAALHEVNRAGSPASPVTGPRCPCTTPPAPQAPRR
ncbi:MAG: hypothetical protein OHK0015_25290 [Chloroflexi bacterium OHK40]